jgi:hypothetical protein
MSPEPWPPEAEQREEAAPPPGDIDSLMNAPPLTVDAEAEIPEREKYTGADITALRGSHEAPRFDYKRNLTDYLIDVLTPVMLVIMVYTVIFFLLDIRAAMDTQLYFREEQDFYLRVVAIHFIIGVVALNRLIARDGSDESIIYMFGLAGAIGLFVFSSQGLYDAQVVSAESVLKGPWVMTLISMGIVAFIWWAVNRLTHECCVDENRVAGDVGLFTGAARRWKQTLARNPDVNIPRRDAKQEKSLSETPFIELEAVDPLAFDPDAPPKKKRPVIRSDFSKRLAGHHPGISIFYFSVPALALFTAGLRTVYAAQIGSGRIDELINFLWWGEWYMLVYSVTALSLLMLTSLAGLREYFRGRRVKLPAGLGPFWIGLGAVIVAVVILGALQLPRPPLPEVPENMAVRIRSQEGQLQQIEAFKQTPFMQQAGRAVLIIMAFFGLYALLRITGTVAGIIARRRDRYPRAVVWFFDRVERFISRFTRLPAPRPRRKRLRVQRDIALSTQYRNSMGDPQLRKRMTTADHIEYAFQALCALAYDLGVPRKSGQTPYEFIRAFPEELGGIRKEAEELVQLYVVSAWSPAELPERVEDRLRRFWITLERVRRRVLK